MKLLVSVDNSAESIEAVNQALDLAEQLQKDSEIVLAHCVDPIISMNGNSYEEDIDRATDLGEQALNASKEVAEERGFDDSQISSELLQINGSETIVNRLTQYIDNGEFDLVFMGHKNRTEKGEKYVGSTTKKLISKSPVPVVAV